MRNITRKMARLTQVAILLIGAMCVVSLPGIFAHDKTPKFFVDGEVYCDVCRADFINRLSERMPGATVRLECKGEVKGNVTYSVEGVTDEQGVYRLAVEGDHDDEICEITLVKSSRPDCSDIANEGYTMKPNSRVELSVNIGIHDQARHANPLTFLKKTVVPQCDELFKELSLEQDF